MHSFHPEVAAAVLGAELAEAYQSAIEPTRRDHFAARIETLLRSAMTAEREACAALCLQRQTLWERTENAPATPEMMRAESRFRSNEAAYLADAIRERSES